MEDFTNWHRVKVCNPGRLYMTDTGKDVVPGKSTMGMKKSKNSAFLAIYTHGYTLSLCTADSSLLSTSEKISHSTSSPECPPSPSAAPWLYQDFEFITPWISFTSFQEQTLPLLPKPRHIHHIHGHWQRPPFSFPRSFNLCSPNSPQQSSFSHKSQHTNTEITFSTFWRIPAMPSQVPRGLRHSSLKTLLQGC